MSSKQAKLQQLLSIILPNHRASHLTTRLLETYLLVPKTRCLGTKNAIHMIGMNELKHVKSRQGGRVSSVVPSKAKFALARSTHVRIPSGLQQPICITILRIPMLSLSCFVRHAI